MHKWLRLQSVSRRLRDMVASILVVSGLGFSLQGVAADLGAGRNAKLIIIAECPSGGTSTGYDELTGSNSAVAIALLAKFSNPTWTCGTPQSGGTALTVEDLTALISYLDWGADTAIRHTGSAYASQAWIRIQPENGCADFAGYSETVWRHGTVSAISGAVITPSFAPAAQLCQRFCRVALEYSLGLYTDVGELPVEVGSPIYAQYQASVTGVTCQAADAGVIPNDEGLPVGEIVDATGGSAGASCVDENNDFIDDVSGLVCELACTDENEDGRDDASGAYCGYEQMTEVHKQLSFMGADLQTGDATLADFGSMFPSGVLLPTTVRNWFNGSGNCSVNLGTVHGTPQMGNVTLPAVEFCEFRTQYASYIQFMMYALTVFVAMGAYRWAIS
jgi:hypothetical protein